MQTRTAPPPPGAGWEPRPFAAWSLRAVAVALPSVAAVGAAWLTITVLPPVRTTAGRFAWLPVLLAVSGTTLVVVDRGARRLLPLAALLRLSLTFPDRAPSRFGVALRAGTLRHLEASLARLRSRGLGDDPGEAAAVVVELVTALRYHEPQTRGHAERTRAYAELIAEELGLPARDRNALRWAALLHDIGKLAVPAEVLAKSGRPDGEDWALLKRHPEEGHRLIEPLRPWLGKWAAAVAQHHERWDGGGYPRGLAGEAISRGARIVTVADCYDVMTSRRSYQRAMSHRAARAELAQCAGSQFDPVVVRAFLRVSIGRLRWTSGVPAWAAQFPLLTRIPLAPVAGAALAGGVVAGGLLGPGFADVERSRAIDAEVQGRVEEIEDGNAGVAGGEPGTPGAPDDSATSSEPGIAPISGFVDGNTTTTTGLPGPLTSTPLTVPTLPTGPSLPPATLVSNTPPLAVADGATARLGSPVVIAVLANDVDADGDDLSVVGFTQGALGGTVMGVGGGEVQYTPAIVGADTFTYTVSDGRGGSAVGTVTVTVTL